MLRDVCASASVSTWLLRNAEGGKRQRTLAAVSWADERPASAPAAASETAYTALGRNSREEAPENWSTVACRSCRPVAAGSASPAVRLA